MDEIKTENQDKTIICCDCGLAFTWEKGEQHWYSEKGYGPPRRCKSCRQVLRRKKQEDELRAREAQNGR